MITAKIGQGGKYLFDRIVGVLVRRRVNPNVLTAIGLFINLLAAYLFAFGYFRWAGLTIVIAAIFDLTDGPVARLSKRVTPFGGFLDSVLDRYSDLLLLTGLLVYYSRGSRFWYVVLVAVAMIGAIMTSYTRARAENVIPSCKVGFLERPERIVLLIIGSLFNRVAAVLWVIVVFSNLTVLHRIIHTYRETTRLARET
ncbi:MAG TPA: CDP-alcohol phosphatidyltransferase family protein [Terriglobia bacterium]|nr:CDP-alcohol phosphatidyltransferase family protein [Terriglobia bacterium]